jgi:hypothetical protein
MKNEPCVRFGIFINPKISEKPADRRKRRPPSVTLLTASTPTGSWPPTCGAGGGLDSPSETKERIAPASA